jgi:hypothetical protein
MTTMTRLLVLALLFACDVDDPGPAPVAGICPSSDLHCASTCGAACEMGSSSTSDATRDVGACDAFLGCMDACAGPSCSSACAAATDSDESSCAALWCDRLVDACAHGDTLACSDVLACADLGTSSEGSSTGETSSTSG